ncbi:YusG family protein [Bacillus sp. FJAT-45350]|uniref:YusG family protein n=1 Tax=Bacillus sp. FJAT-45350 TaxID=2011014 RepID=UPI000BB768EC|nr:YusG family protein [Bacillus sp. FJAT-45350]
MNDNHLKKVDVTSKVEGKLENGAMNLYIDEAKVGKIVMTNQGNQYEMAEDFEFEENKVYRYENDHPEKEKQYVEGCDMGWC